MSPYVIEKLEKEASIDALFELICTLEMHMDLCGDYSVEKSVFELVDNYECGNYKFYETVYFIFEEFVDREWKRHQVRVNTRLAEPYTDDSVISAKWRGFEFAYYFDGTDVVITYLLND